MSCLQFSIIINNAAMNILVFILLCICIFIVYIFKQIIGLRCSTIVDADKQSSNVAIPSYLPWAMYDSLHMFATTCNK